MLTVPFIPDADVQTRPISNRPELVELGGGYGITAEYGKPGVLDNEGKPVIGLDKYETAYLDGKALFVASARPEAQQNFSAATLPKSRLLILGEKFFKLFNNPTEETRLGYRPSEAVDMILGHELTHIRFGQLNQAQQDEINSFYAQYWGHIHVFAQQLMARADYRDKIITSSKKTKTKDTQVKTRPVTVNGNTYEVVVDEIVNELLAFSSAGSLIEENRLTHLVEVNPTGEFNCREHLSVSALNALNKIQKASNTAKLPGEDLHQDLGSIISQVKLTIPKLQT